MQHAVISTSLVSTFSSSRQDAPIASSTVALCRKCPVRRACLDHAYQHEIVSGYFGGVSPGRRRVLSHAEAIAEIERDGR